MATVDGMAAIRETFFQECAEQLVEVEAGLAAMNEGTSDAETVNAVFRAVHSIKGGAGAFQLDRLVRFAHAFETALDLLRGGKIALSEALLKTMFHSNDALADLVAAERGGGKVGERRMDALTDELCRLAVVRQPNPPPIRWTGWTSAHYAFLGRVRLGGRPPTHAPPPTPLRSRRGRNSIRKGTKQPASPQIGPIGRNDRLLRCERGASNRRARSRRGVSQLVHRAHVR